MKSTLLTLTALFAFCSQSHALECPSVKLECIHTEINTNGIPKILEMKSVKFSGVNTDEPSVEANECVASVSFLTKNPMYNLQIVVKDDLKAFMYVGSFYSALNPQFEVEATLNKPMKISNGLESMSCMLK